MKSFTLVSVLAFATYVAAQANGGPPFDPAGAGNVGNGAGKQFIGGQCLSGADCGSGCCAGPSGICSGPGAQTQAGKTGFGFGRIHVPMLPMRTPLHRSATSMSCSGISLALLTNDLVLRHLSGTFSAQMRIRISSWVRLGTRAVLTDSEYPILGTLTLPYARCSFPPRGSIICDMHRDHPHSPPPASAFCSSTTRNAMQPHHTRGTSPWTPYHALVLNTRLPCTQDNPRSKRCRSSTRALPSLICRRSNDLQRSPHLSVLGALLRAPQLGCMTPAPCAAAVTSIPHRIRRRRFPRLLRRLSPALPQSPLHACLSRVAPTTICTITYTRSVRGGSCGAAFFCPHTKTIDTSPLRLPGLPSTQEHPYTPDALPTHTGTRRAAPPVCTALDVAVAHRRGHSATLPLPRSCTQSTTSK
ncbi:hypothetical protein MVEN_00626900 [Mycena venus]|uniref:Hydrophobin n=1 Tax=Mycena venus TaxID=2733690 RepID=A0A8H7D7Y7_9AGAR|nr:hypothetical protein MVEN_00626900 [Mycena venus]